LLGDQGIFHFGWNAVLQRFTASSPSKDAAQNSHDYNALAGKADSTIHLACLIKTAQPSRLAR
jgi:hypothetical protein